MQRIRCISCGRDLWVTQYRTRVCDCGVCQRALLSLGGGLNEGA